MTGTCASSTTSSALAWWFLLLSPCWDDRSRHGKTTEKRTGKVSETQRCLIRPAFVISSWSPCFLFRRSIWHKAGRGLCISAALCTCGVGRVFSGAMFETWTDQLWVAGPVGRHVWLPNGGFQSMVAPNHLFSERFSHGNQPSSDQGVATWLRKPMETSKWSTNVQEFCRTSSQPRPVPAETRPV